MKMRLPWRRNRREHAAEPTPARRRKRPRRARIALGVAGLAVLIAGSVYGRERLVGPPVEPATLAVPVIAGDLDVKVESSGTARPSREIDLKFQAAGQVQEVLVKPGDLVKAGQPLARLDDTELRVVLQQAEASLKTAQAELTEAREGGATPEELAEAEAGVDSASANLEKTVTGNVTAADIRNAEATVRGAEAQLQRARTGNVTAADIQNAEAQLRSAEAGLLRAQTGNVTAADIQNAEAQLRSAEAQLQKVQRGPAPDTLSTARTNLEQAQQNLEKTAATAASNKVTAEQAMQQAADNVRLEQQNYSRAYWNDQQAQNGQNPATGNSFEDDHLNADVQKREYADALRTAELSLSQAESRLEQARINFENIRQQEINDVAVAQAQVDNAQVQLDEASKGSAEEDIIVVQAQVDQARANLQKLQTGGTPADIAAAQAQVDQARANLQKLRQGGTAADIAAAQANLDQARAGLQKLRQGGSQADIDAARAQVDQAQAHLGQLTAPKAPSKLALAEANVIEQEAKVAEARLDLQQATMTAPFDGTVATVDVVPGDFVAAGASGSAALVLVDTSSMRVDVNLSESDITSVQPGQAVEITFDAIEGQVITGTVEAVAPTATEGQNIVTYLVQVQFQPGIAPVKAGMTASANILVERKENIIQVPNRALRSDGPFQTVQVLHGAGQTPVTVQVETGASNEATTEIVRCIETGKQCLRPGDRLQITLPELTTSGSDPQGNQTFQIGPSKGGVQAGPAQRIIIK